MAARSIKADRVLARGTEGYSDLSEVVVAQMGRAFVELLRVCPGFMFKRPDLIGYQFINFGTDSVNWTESALGVADGARVYKDWKEAEVLATNTDRTRAAQTQEALIQQIIVRGSHGKSNPVTASHSLEDYFDQTLSPDHMGIPSIHLVPRRQAGVEAYYKGRTETHLGEFVGRKDNFVHDLTVYNDFVELHVNDNRGPLVVVTSSNATSPNCWQIDGIAEV